MCMHIDLHGYVNIGSGTIQKIVRTMQSYQPNESDWHWGSPSHQRGTKPQL